MEKKHTRGSFTGSIGFVLAAAGSAVGLGNIWRFPYLAAKDGGGTFILVYIVLALTFGFTLLTTDIAIEKRDKVRLSLMEKFTRAGTALAFSPVSCRLSSCLTTAPLAAGY